MSSFSVFKKDYKLFPVSGGRGVEPAAGRGIFPEGARLPGAVHTLRGAGQEQMISFMNNCFQRKENVVPSQTSAQRGNHASVCSVPTNLSLFFKMVTEILSLELLISLLVNFNLFFP
jgi:hypothetical protein